MTTELRVKLPRPHQAQQEILEDMHRFKVLVCGRRFGKTTYGLHRFRKALEGQPVAWFAPIYKMLEEPWRETKARYADVLTRSGEQSKRLELVTGGSIEFWSLDNIDGARGRKYAHIIIDEAAIVRNLEEAWQAVIRPTLTDFQGSADFLSTPKGMNFFRRLYEWGKDPARQDWRAWQLPTSANPFIATSEIEAARLELPERVFYQEYLAEFLEDAGGVFRKVAAVSTLQPADPVPGRRYVWGVDWGKMADFTVVSILDPTTKRQVFLDRFNQIDYSFQLKRLKDLAERYRPSAVIAEQNSIGVPLIESLIREGLPVQPFLTTNVSKAQGVEALSLALERADISLIADEVQIAELQAYEAERLPSGLMRYGAPLGTHDDTVMALMLAYQGLLPDGKPTATTTLAALRGAAGR